MKQNQPATDVAAIRRAYGQFLSKGRVPRGIVPDFIERSWQRSAAFGVAYDRIREIGRVDETDLRIVVSQYGSLINLATPVMVLSSSPGAWCNASMDTSTAPGYRGYRVPVEIISHCGWLHFRFCLSFRDVQEMMLERGVVVSHEAVRLWCLKFGAEYTRRLRHRRGRPGDTWHLDEVFCKINGQLVYLWRAVDQEGEVLDILVQSRRDARAAKRFFKKLLKRLLYSPRVLVTDKLSSYTTAHRELIPEVEHRRGGRLNNRAENSHQPTRERERRMRRFKSMKHAQRFLSPHGQVSNHFRCERHLMRACHYRNKMVQQFAAWRMVCGLDQAAIVDRRLTCQ